MGFAPVDHHPREGGWAPTRLLANVGEGPSSPLATREPQKPPTPRQWRPGGTRG